VETVSDEASIESDTAIDAFQKILAAVERQHAAEHAKRVSLEPPDALSTSAPDCVPTPSGFGMERHETNSPFFAPQWHSPPASTCTGPELPATVAASPAENVNHD
jgi:hypothetical protein